MEENKAKLLNIRVLVFFAVVFATLTGGLIGYFAYPWTYEQCLKDAASKPSDRGVSLAQSRCEEEFNSVATAFTSSASAMPQTRDTSTVKVDSLADWTQETTGSADVGPWLDYDPIGTRYYRDSNRIVIRVYPPGAKPGAALAELHAVQKSSAAVPE